MMTECYIGSYVTCTIFELDIFFTQNVNFCLKGCELKVKMQVKRTTCYIFGKIGIKKHPVRTLCYLENVESSIFSCNFTSLLLSFCCLHLLI